MIFKPKLHYKSSSTSIEVLKDAFLLYGIDITLFDQSCPLKSLNMDDIDFLEAIQLIETAIFAKIDKRGIGPSTTISAVARLIDAARNGN